MVDLVMRLLAFLEEQHQLSLFPIGLVLVLLGGLIALIPRD